MLYLGEKMLYKCISKLLAKMRKQTHKSEKIRIVSSHELNVQVSFYDHILYVVRLSGYLSVSKLFTFSIFSPEPQDQFQQNLA